MNRKNRCWAESGFFKRPRFRVGFGLTSSGSGRFWAKPTRPDSISGANRLNGQSDKDVESVNNDEFFACLFNQSESKKDAAAKQIEGFLSAVPVKKIDDNSFADAALKKLFVQYKTLPSSSAVERLFSSAGHRKFKLYFTTANFAK